MVTEQEENEVERKGSATWLKTEGVSPATIGIPEGQKCPLVLATITAFY